MFTQHQLDTLNQLVSIRTDILRDAECKLKQVTILDHIISKLIRTFKSENLQLN